MKRHLLGAAFAVAGVVSVATPSSAVDACVGESCVSVDVCNVAVDCGPVVPPVDCAWFRYAYICW